MQPVPDEQIWLLHFKGFHAIHPGARIGKGVMFDHATSVVIGETAVVEDTHSFDEVEGWHAGRRLPA